MGEGERVNHLEVSTIYRTVSGAGLFREICHEKSRTKMFMNRIVFFSSSFDIYFFFFF